MSTNDNPWKPWTRYKAWSIARLDRPTHPQFAYRNNDTKNSIYIVLLNEVTQFRASWISLFSISKSLFIYKRFVLIFVFQIWILVHELDSTTIGWNFIFSYFIPINIFEISKFEVFRSSNHPLLLKFLLHVRRTRGHVSSCFKNRDSLMWNTLCILCIHF